MQNVMNHDGFLAPAAAAGHVTSLAFKSMASKLLDRGDPLKVLFRDDIPRFLGEGEFTKDGYLCCKSDKDRIKIWRMHSSMGFSIYLRDGPKVAFSQTWKSLVAPGFSIRLPKKCRQENKEGYDRLLGDIRSHLAYAVDSKDPYHQTIFQLPAAELQTFTQGAIITPKEFKLELNGIKYIMTTITSRSDTSNKFYIKAKKSRKSKLDGKHAISMHGYIDICRAWDPLIDQGATAKLPDSAADFVNELILTNFQGYEHLRQVIFWFSLLNLTTEKILDCQVKSVEWRKEQDVFRHEYIVFELQLQESQGSPRRSFFLRTERNTRTYKEAFFTGPPTDHISGICIEANRASKTNDNIVVSMQVTPLAPRVAMRDVVEIVQEITKSSPKYKLWSTMCWWFARTCMAKLANRFTQDDDAALIIRLEHVIRGRLELKEVFNEGVLSLKRLQAYCRTPTDPKLPPPPLDDKAPQKIRMYTDLADSIWTIMANLGSWILEVCIPDVVWKSFRNGFRGLKALRTCLLAIARGQPNELLASHLTMLRLVAPLMDKDVLARRRQYPENLPFGQTQQVHQFF